MKAYRSSIPLALLALFTLAVTPAACGDDAVVGPEPAPMEWFEVSWSGGTIQVALLRPADETSGPHPVIFALPWGAGSQELVLTFMSSYWSRVPGLQGYYVVSPAVRGSDLEHTADEVIPAIFDWMDQELDYNPSQVALVGASNALGDVLRRARGPGPLCRLDGAARTVRRGRRGAVRIGRKARVADRRRAGHRLESGV